MKSVSTLLAALFAAHWGGREEVWLGGTPSVGAKSQQSGVGGSSHRVARTRIRCSPPVGPNPGKSGVGWGGRGIEAAVQLGLGWGACHWRAPDPSKRSGWEGVGLGLGSGAHCLQAPDPGNSEGWGER